MRFIRRIEAVVVDLDGTLIDTAPDLAEAANRMLREMGLPLRDAAEITAFIGQGIKNLVARCLGSVLADSPERSAAALAIFETEYAAVSGHLSRVFPGAREGLAMLRDQDLRLACVTNKASAYTLPLLAHFDLARDFELVLSGDTLEKKKPDPGPLLHACRLLGIDPEATLVIGDSPNDTRAARAAGCPVACVPYGYREGLKVRELDCDVIVSTLAEAASLISGSNMQRPR